MKFGIVLGLVVPAALVAASAFADDKAACLDAASKGQRLRDTHKLVEAREQLRVCAAAQCPAVVQSDCATWLAEVERALPGVVLTAKNGAGADLVDVKVSVDGQTLVSRLDGQAVLMNAGPHIFHFEGADGATLDQQVVVKEGDKYQSIAVVLGKAPTPATGAPVSAQGAQRPDQPPTDRRDPSPWRTVGWVAGGVGLVGLGVGMVFGMKAISDKNGARCDSSGACDAGPLADANSSATVATIGIVAGGALLAGGVALVLFAGKSAEPVSRLPSLKVAPLLGAQRGGLVLQGTW